MSVAKFSQVSTIEEIQNPRESQIEVTFDIDSNAILNGGEDNGTGKIEKIEELYET